MGKIARWLVVSAVLLEAVLLAPVLYDVDLRFAYTQTLARWLSKAVAPNTVFIGDSLTAGGRNFNDLRDINLGSNGLQTYQIAANMTKALTFAPRHVAIMAGTNDAIEGPIDEAEITRLWRTICAQPKIVVTKVTPTASDELNSRIDEINRIIGVECKGRPIIDLGLLAGPNGKVQPRYTADGVHPSSAAYATWRAALRRYGI